MDRSPCLTKGYCILVDLVLCCVALHRHSASKVWMSQIGSYSSENICKPFQKETKPMLMWYLKSGYPTRCRPHTISRQVERPYSNGHYCKKRMLHSSYWFRSSDLRVMSPAIVS